MYQLDDTITAISSPKSEQMAIIRIDGPDTLGVIKKIFTTSGRLDKGGFVSGTISVGSGVELDAGLYIFISPNSYTGNTLAEIHIYTNTSVVQELLSRLLDEFGIRIAEPGEFTARAFFNGKVDLAQAEAINAIIASSNELQLSAAEKLLGGKLTETLSGVRRDLIEVLTMIEAGLDFSTHKIEFASLHQQTKKLTGIKSRLEKLLEGGIRAESVINLPVVAIAGAPNVGKSSLLNALLGYQRSIVSDSHKTTRDVLTGILKLPRCECVLVDCAGLIDEPVGTIEELAQQSARQVLKDALVIIYCIDTPNSKPPVAIAELLESKEIIHVVTKSDMSTNSFDGCCLAVSAKTKDGIDQLREIIENKITKLTGQSEQTDSASLVARHRNIVTKAIGHITDLIEQLKNGDDEVAAMTLRLATQELSGIEQQGVDEEVLSNIFSSFCVGK